METRTSFLCLRVRPRFQQPRRRTRPVNRTTAIVNRPAWDCLAKGCFRFATNRCLNTSSVLVFIHCPYICPTSLALVLFYRPISPTIVILHLAFVVFENPHTIKCYDCRHFSRLFIDKSANTFDISCGRHLFAKYSK